MNLNKNTYIQLRSGSARYSSGWTTETTISRTRGNKQIRHTYKAEDLTDASRARLAKVLAAQGWTTSIELDPLDMEITTSLTWIKPVHTYQVFWRFANAPSWVCLPNMWVARDVASEEAAITDAKAHAETLRTRTPNVDMGEVAVIGVKLYVRPATAYTGRYDTKAAQS